MCSIVYSTMNYLLSMDKCIDTVVFLGVSRVALDSILLITVVISFLYNTRNILLHGIYPITLSVF